MSISENKVKKILKISKLSADKDELKMFVTDLNKVVSFFSNIHIFKTDNIEPMISPLTQDIQLRLDIVKNQDVEPQLSKLFPWYQKGHCIVPMVIE